LRSGAERLAQFSAGTARDVADEARFFGNEQLETAAERELGRRRALESRTLNHLRRAWT